MKTLHFLIKTYTFHKQVDVVIMNPPFGTKKNAGIDMKFLRAGAVMARKAVYSLHKTSTRDYIEKTTTKWGLKHKVVAKLKYDLPATYRCHKQKSVDIQVDLVRLDCTNKPTL